MKSLIALHHHASPIGHLHIAFVKDVPLYIGFDTENWVTDMEKYIVRHFGPQVLTESTTGPKSLLKQLDRYFSGKPEDFETDLLLHGTEFQIAVWKAVYAIPFGRTTTYASIAESVGRPSAVRAAGTAIGSNPLPLIIPCHRVVASNGGLAGFGGGLDRKRFLLELEQKKG